MLITNCSFSCFYFSHNSVLRGETCNAEPLLKVQLFEGLPNKMHAMKIYNVRAFIFVCIFKKINISITRAKISSISDLSHQH